MFLSFLTQETTTKLLVWMVDDGGGWRDRSLAFLYIWLFKFYPSVKLGKRWTKENETCRDSMLWNHKKLNWNGAAGKTSSSAQLPTRCLVLRLCFCCSGWSIERPIDVVFYICYGGYPFYDTQDNLLSIESGPKAHWEMRRGKSWPVATSWCDLWLEIIKV